MSQERPTLQYLISIPVIKSVLLESATVLLEAGSFWY